MLNLTDKQRAAISALSMALVQCARAGVLETLESFCVNTNTTDDIVRALEQLALVDQSERK